MRKRKMLSYAFDSWTAVKESSVTRWNKFIECGSMNEVELKFTSKKVSEWHDDHLHELSSYNVDEQLLTYNSTNNSNVNDDNGDVCDGLTGDKANGDENLGLTGDTVDGDDVEGFTGEAVNEDDDNHDDPVDGDDVEGFTGESVNEDDDNHDDPVENTDT
eukprot:6488244-Ditylum_brightwellii.AAC.1